MEDKFAIKPLGAPAELRGPNRAFVYFKCSDLRRAMPLPEPEVLSEPPLKQAKLEAAAEPAQVDQAESFATDTLRPGRLEGRVKWFSKEKGFGKIMPFVANGQVAEDIFVHRSQMEGGPDSPHAQAIAEGSFVSYEVTTHIDGKPCATSVQVHGVAQALAALDPKATLGNKEDLIRRLLLSGMKVGTFQEKGQFKASMEDRMIVRAGVSVHALGTSCRKAVCALFGVFDGHSGASCSDFVATNLDRSLFDCLRHQSRRDVGSDMAMRSALLAAFRMTEHNYFQYLNKLEGGAAHAWATAGSTACTAVFFGPDEDGRLRLAVANAGDSRVVLGTRDGRAIRLSEDHTPNVPSERKRIEAEGSAVVNASGIWRIVLPSKKGLGLAGLSVSRGFGDLEYKQPAGVVSAVPDVFLRVLDLREDSFIVICSDGVWGPVTDADAVRIVAAGLREGGDDPAKQAAQQLVEEAHRRDEHDDKTALVVWFGDTPAAPAVPPTATPPVHMAPARLLPPKQAATGNRATHDDMFAVRRPAAAGELSELDDLFSSYARELVGK
eukprot:CAMPEP_0179089630 /NCGR_PEP_ID=MMETSP0796-20121207/40850_1 /TAXON_ID=73915 /ORGANISM="Pyrodinium bahamense, Strain pbaha01" /LENGTH=550 /DNA_ID=CAMNT_0020787189 /DNA_START=217 /DNA_END=1869 /DNA_ORIENTATION=+